jgi:hypothetical protein
MRLFSYWEKGPTGVWNIINAGRGNIYKHLTHLILHEPDHHGSDPGLSPMPSAKNRTKLPSLRCLRLANWHVEFPGTLSGFRAPKLHTLDLLELHQNTVLSIAGLLEELQKFPVLHTLRVCTDVTTEEEPPLSMENLHLSLRHLSLMPYEPPHPPHSPLYLT